MDEVACPGCGREKFPAVAGSECYCSCGTAFKIAENGATVRVPRGVVGQDMVASRIVRKLLGTRQEKTRPA